MNQPDFSPILLPTSTMAFLAGWICLLLAIAPATWALSPGASLDDAHALVKSMPENPVAHYSLGVSLDQAKRFREALVAYRETIRRDPEFAAAYERIGLVAGRLRDFPLSTRAFQEAIRRAPGDAELWYNLGVTLGNAGNHADAIRVYRVCLFLKPDHVDGRFNLELASKKLKRGRQPLPAVVSLDRNRFVSLVASPTFVAPQKPHLDATPAATPFPPTNPLDAPPREIPAFIEAFEFRGISGTVY
jgi:tetratricopeptide (TPR) repeat protein